MNTAILTVGHSNHPLEFFLYLLKKHSVGAVADVRSVPYSRFVPHFDRKPLASSLREVEIDYVYLGRELGGRSDDPSCYEEGHIQYDRIAKTDRFKRGLGRVINDAAAKHIALMCSEKDPLDCHRTLLVARALDEQGITVAHIRSTAELESHADAMDRLLAKFPTIKPNLFDPTPRPREDLVAAAIALQSERVAFAGGPAATTEQS